MPNSGARNLEDWKKRRPKRLYAYCVPHKNTMGIERVSGMEHQNERYCNSAKPRGNNFQPGGVLYRKLIQMKILVPTDFSEVSEYGLKVARDIALKNEAEIYLVNYIEPADERGFSATGDISTRASIAAEAFIIEMTKKNSQLIHDLALKYEKDHVTIKPVIEVDYFEDAMDQYIVDKGIDLVVMGTTGERSYDELIFGNHTERVIRISHAPTLSVKSYDHKFEPRDMVLAVDLTTEGSVELAYFKRFADWFHATVHLVNVNKQKNAADQVLREKMENEAQQAGFTSYTINVINGKEKKKSLESFAAEKKADLIGVITRARSPFINLFFGSLTEKLVKETDKPTLALTVNMEKK